MRIKKNKNIKQKEIDEIVALKTFAFLVHVRFNESVLTNLKKCFKNVPLEDRGCIDHGRPNQYLSRNLHHLKQILKAPPDMRYSATIRRVYGGFDGYLVRSQTGYR